MDRVFLNSLADSVVSAHTTSPKSFCEAKINLTEGGYSYSFDSLSLCCYEHNFDSESYNYFYRELHDRLFNKLNREEKKMLDEYSTLFQLSLHDPKFASMIIEKTERPDFTLRQSNGKILGIEVVQLTTQSDALLYSFSSELLAKSVSNVKDANTALKRHGSKANGIQIVDFGEHLVVQSPRKELDCDRQIYADEIKVKYKKYTDIIADYDDFFVLCDARKSISLTESFEADEIASKVSDDIQPRLAKKSHFQFYILWSDSTSQQHLNKYYIVPDLCN